MSDDVKLKVQPREGTGSGEAGRLRREGQVPGVIYGDGEKGEAIQFVEREMEDILRHHSSGNVLVDLEFDGKPVRKVLLKDVQQHPLTGRPVHADFHTINLKANIKVMVPIELTGEAKGVTQQGGTLEQLVREIEVECLPGDMLEAVSVDVSGLNIGEHVTVESITLDTGKYTILTAPEVAVAGVAAPRVEEEPAEGQEGAEGEEGAAGEPEVISEKKEDSEDESKDEG